MGPVESLKGGGDLVGCLNAAIAAPCRLCGPLFPAVAAPPALSVALLLLLLLMLLLMLMLAGGPVVEALPAHLFTYTRLLSLPMATNSTPTAPAHSSRTLRRSL